MTSVSAAVPDGYVVKVDSATVYLDWGKASGAAAGDQFKIYRGGEPLKHPVTGEILGQTEQDVGQGVLDRIEERFSTGKLLQTKGRVKPGDRTRRLETIAVAVPAAESVVPAHGLQELWHSDAMAHQATGLAIGDVDGDGKKEVVVSFRDQVEVFRWNGQKLESIGVFKARGYDNYLAVETMDIDGAGHDKIFASLFLEGSKRAKTFVLEYTEGQLKEVGRFDGFVRGVEHAAPEGRRELVWQEMSLSRELRMRAPAVLAKTAKGYREGDPLKLSHPLLNDQLFGFTWGDWDGDGTEDFAVLVGGERLRIFFKDAKWNGGDSYGGTRSDFNWENEQVGGIFPRLVSWKPGAGKTQLLVPHNIPFIPFRLARIKIYKSAEIIGLAWNGQDMAPVWTLPLPGALADFGIGDGRQSGTPQLWAAVVGSSDKTTLFAYQTP